MLYWLSVLLAIPIGVYLLLLIGWHLLRRHLLSTTSGLLELPLLAKSRSSAQKIPGTAVICGGSIAGLFAARVCHDHFERVLVVEAEPWVASEEGRRVDGWKQTHQRSRVMQFTSLHMSQAFVYRAMKYMFPDLDEECRRSEISIMPADPAFVVSGVPIPMPSPYRESGFPSAMFASRMGTELTRTVIRRLVLDKTAHPNIEYITGTVTDVLPSPTDHSRLSTVVIRTVSGIQEFEAALVADCTGPARVGLKWLQRHGYGYLDSAPSSGSQKYPNGTLPLDQLKISLDQKLRYTSILFRLRPEFHDSLPLPSHLKNLKKICTYIDDGSEESLKMGKGMFVLVRGDGGHLCAFTGHYGSVRSQPTNITEMKDYVRSFKPKEPIPEWIFGILDMLEDIQDEGSVSALKIPPTTNIQYHRAVNLPSNFVALGDSVITVNPVYGEGTAKALRCVLSLHKMLHSALSSGVKDTLPPDFSMKFFAEAHGKTDWMWQSTRLADYGLPTTEPIVGETLSSGAFWRRYGNHMQALAPKNELAAWVFYTMLAGLGTPIDAMHPRLMFRVLWSMCWSS
ncbi:hypothetical protein R3P38DRAFT_2541121 [Favolaschia claudopus]|uniref:FAD/NAD(P)-binding domain-containing protein n=1 Tax=Favolaschia claudopus TaxID=2862362 RepID=A0AAW0AU57_9AGAR